MSGVTSDFWTSHKYCRQKTLTKLISTGTLRSLEGWASIKCNLKWKGAQKTCAGSEKTTEIRYSVIQDSGYLITQVSCTLGLLIRNIGAFIVELFHSSLLWRRVFALKELQTWNHRRKLLHSVVPSQTLEDSPPHSIQDSHTHSNSGFLSKFKSEVPRFNGTNPEGWTFKVNQFFQFHHTPKD